MTNPVLEKILSRARAAGKRIVLPETDDPRVLKAARAVTDQGYAAVTLLGQPQKVQAAARALGLSLEGIEIIDHLAEPQREKYVQALFEKRKAKGMTRDQADALLKGFPYYGAMLVGDGRVDGMVVGSICPTADTVRAGIFGVGLSPGNKTVSSCSVMLTQIAEFGVQGAVIFADTGVLPTPTVEQLADIAVAAAQSCRVLLDTEPLVAMISFSTKGSAKGPEPERVIAATRLAQQRCPQLKIDGELQVDAAMMPDIAARKCQGSPVAGKANTLVFPDLNCGNSAYKLVERFGRAAALGPLLQGLARPINDLSRGCSVDDIAQVTAITCLQATGGQ